VEAPSHNPEALGPDWLTALRVGIEGHRYGVPIVEPSHGPLEPDGLGLALDSMGRHPLDPVAWGNVGIIPKGKPKGGELHPGIHRGPRGPGVLVPVGPRSSGHVNDPARPSPRAQPHPVGKFQTTRPAIPLESALGALGGALKQGQRFPLMVHRLGPRGLAHSWPYLPQGTSTRAHEPDPRRQWVSPWLPISGHRWPSKRVPLHLNRTAHHCRGARPPFQGRKPPFQGRKYRNRRNRQGAKQRGYAVAS